MKRLKGSATGNRTSWWRQSARRSIRFRASIDSLEERTLLTSDGSLGALAPTALVVTNGADSGPGSLRDAIAAAETQGTSSDPIEIVPGVGTIVLNSYIAISEGIQIDGNGATIAITTSQGPAFDFGGGVDGGAYPDILNDLVLVGGGDVPNTGSSAALITSTAAVFLNDCTVTNWTLGVANQGSLSVNGGVFAHNGTAILNQDIMYVQGGNFLYNQTGVNDAAWAPAATVSNVTFALNSATALMANGPMSINGCSFTSNSALSNTEAADIQSALEPNQQLIVNKCNFNGTNLGGPLVELASAGAVTVPVHNQPGFILTDNTFSGKNLYGDLVLNGAAQLAVTDDLFENNIVTLAPLVQVNGSVGFTGDRFTGNILWQDLLKMEGVAGTVVTWDIQECGFDNNSTGTNDGAPSVINADMGTNATFVMSGTTIADNSLAAVALTTTNEFDYLNNPYWENNTIVNNIGGGVTLYAGANAGSTNSNSAWLKAANCIIAGNGQTSTCSAQPDIVLATPGVIFYSDGFNLIGNGDGLDGTQWLSSDIVGSSSQPINPEVGSLTSDPRIAEQDPVANPLVMTLQPCSPAVGTGPGGHNIGATELVVGRNPTTPTSPNTGTQGNQNGSGSQAPPNTGTQSNPNSAGTQGNQDGSGSQAPPNTGNQGNPNSGGQQTAPSSLNQSSPQNSAPPNPAKPTPPNPVPVFVGPVPIAINLTGHRLVLSAQRHPQGPPALIEGNPVRHRSGKLVSMTFTVNTPFWVVDGSRREIIPRSVILTVTGNTWQRTVLERLARYELRAGQHGR